MKRRQVHGEGGAAAVEFALVSILLFTLLFGIIGFGFALFKKNSATHAAREGARLAAVGITSCSGFETEVKDRGQGANVQDVTVAFGAGGNAVNSSVIVEVDYSVDLSLIGAFVPGIPSSLSLTETGESRVERKSTGDAASGCV